MLTTTELLKKVRRIEIRTRGLSNHIFAGEYHSAFKGRGMSFSEVREYAAGDDVRSIDWNVTARMRTPFVKVFEEERELTVMLLVDVSASTGFGTQQRLKRDLITEICAVLAFSASTNSDKVGVIFFADKVEGFIPPKKGRSHILRIIRELLSMEPVQSVDTRINEALDYLNNVLKKRTITFLLSDMISAPFDTAIQVAARRHDLVGVQVYDKHDQELPQVGLLQVKDAETGNQLWLDTDDKTVRAAYTKNFEQTRQYAMSMFRKSGARLIEMRTDQDYVKVLQGFFKGR